MDTLKDIPEFFETRLDESLDARREGLATFRELGPPDLCHITKANAKPGVKEVGSYHYVSGVDASSSATLAAYLNSLTYALEEAHAWFSKSSAWRIRSGVYCCFNAFSRVDVRVEVKIPGGVESYVIDLRGERREATPEIWQETYISAILRAILYSDDANYRLYGIRKLDPIPNIEAEAHFLEAAEQLFFKGWQLGSDPEIQVATVVNNHLTAGIMKYFSESFRYERAESEVAALLAKSYIGMDEEIKAVNILYDALKQNSLSCALLHVQTDFLLSKGAVEYALKLAKQAVNCAPSEFVTWAKLTEVYIELGDYESALLSLNSCPMFTYNERDMHRMPTPARSHLPVRADIANAGILGDDNIYDNEFDEKPILLPASSLRGTFAKAYLLLTRLVHKVGWDALLKFRSSVFVMEEEYRLQKAAEEERQKRVHKSISQAALQETVNGNADHKKSDEKTSVIPKITVSTANESENVNNDTAENEGNENTSGADKEAPVQTATKAATQQEETRPEETQPEETQPEETSGKTDDETDGQSGDPDKLEDVNLGDSANGDGNSNIAESKPETHELRTPELVKPRQAANEDTSDAQSTCDESKDDIFSFNNKRLCERWLDNLFMVLYEDLRIYTGRRSELSHYEAHQLTYRKSSAEWEMFGDLAARLYHKEESIEAYQHCLDQKFSPKACLKLLEYYAEKGDAQKALAAAVKLTVYQERWYHEIIYPTAVSCNLNKLIRKEGLAIMYNTLLAMNLPETVLKLVLRYFTFTENFKIQGYDF
ncbi:1437_t:CDS:10 [Paraglomus brasilianum]|uniref:1437_t:CDS:1 n=1 Tax=Paraglomus brasilianum TaxID=144538 RepID=A0A9N9AAG1_9GLOM|nr:1437_t:CDS:10 [Paraglomus brasilianum]